MKWGDFVELNDKQNVDIWIEILADQIKRALNHPLDKFDTSKPFRLGWYVEQD